jgi:osmotically inducible protein OsmC
MALHYANAVWQGDFKGGRGTVRLGKDGHTESYSAARRFENSGGGTSPEELIGAAHAGCFSMALSADLTQAGYPPDRIETDAKVEIRRGDAGLEISSIELTTRAVVPGIDEAEFMKFAEGTKRGCPVSKALTGVDIRLTASLSR